MVAWMVALVVLASLAAYRLGLRAGRQDGLLAVEAVSPDLVGPVRDVLQRAGGPIPKGGRDA